jgi:hypothetical protein
MKLTLRFEVEDLDWTDATLVTQGSIVCDHPSPHDPTLRAQHIMDHYAAIGSSLGMSYTHFLEATPAEAIERGVTPMDVPECQRIYEEHYEHMATMMGLHDSGQQFIQHLAKALSEIAPTNAEKRRLQQIKDAKERAKAKKKGKK